MVDFSNLLSSISSAFQSFTGDFGSDFSSGIDNIAPSFDNIFSGSFGNFNSDPSSIWSNWGDGFNFGNSGGFMDSFGMPDIFSSNPLSSCFGGGFDFSGIQMPNLNPFASSSNNVRPEDATVVKNINDNFKGELANAGEMIVSIANEYKIDPSLFAAIMAQESGWGEQASGFNFGGLMGSDGLQSFGSLEEGLRAVANTISKYYEEGKTTADAIGPEYCPVGASNDNGTNCDWIGAVNKIQSQLCA